MVNAEKKDRNTVLILGSNGFIGQHLASRLTASFEVVGYDRSIGSTPIETVCGDFASEDRFEELLSQNHIKTVYHLISTTTPKEDTSDTPQEIESNVVPTVRLLEAMHHTGVGRIVFISSGGTVYGESRGMPHKADERPQPLCGYGVQKTVIEQYLQFYGARYGMDCRIARLSNPYGIPPQRNRGQGIIPILLERILTGEPITLYGDTIRDYIHIDDAVEALARFGAYEGDIRIMNIGSGVPLRLSEMISMIEDTTGQRFTAVNRLPRRQCDVQENVLDIQETVKALQWQPMIDIRTGIKLTWASLQALRAQVSE